VAAILVAGLHGQPLLDPGLVCGPWETTTASGVHGVWLDINTQHRAKHTTTQGISLSFYHRVNGQETGASPGEQKGSFSTSLRLRAQGVDLSFDAGSQRWTGSWVLDGETRQVDLTRPTCRSHPLCGTWQGRDLAGPVLLHIAQSSDGFVTAWMNKDAKSSDQRHGDRLRVVSPEPANFVVETISAGCCTNRFSGRLSDDGLSLIGKWSSLKINVDAQQVFRRIP